MVLVTAKFADYPMWTAYTYVGDLCSGAFGWNELGIAFTLNQVSPTDTRLV
jgi:hypothetical protein